MNLKEAFRFQNKLQALMNEAQSILNLDRNVCQVQTTLLRSKVMPEAENETTIESAPSEYADRINDVIGLLLYLLNEHEILAKCIHDAKATLPIDMDSEVSLNARRQAIASTLSHMADLRSSEQVISNGGMGYRFNAEGNQVAYRCDVKRVTTINFDRNMVRRKAAVMNQQNDFISSQIDSCMVNTKVTYTPPFDVNSSFAAIFEVYSQKQGA